MAKAPKTYPNTTFERAARDAGAHVVTLWEIPGPKNTSIAWLTAYSVGGRLAIVQTYVDDNGWDVLTPCGENSVSVSLADALVRCGVSPLKVGG